MDVPYNFLENLWKSGFGMAGREAVWPFAHRATLTNSVIVIIYQSFLNMWTSWPRIVIFNGGGWVMKIDWEIKHSSISKGDIERKILNYSIEKWAIAKSSDMPNSWSPNPDKPETPWYQLKQFRKSSLQTEESVNNVWKRKICGWIQKLRFCPTYAVHKSRKRGQ